MEESQHRGCTPTSCAAACQCRGCGTRLPAWIAEEYGSLTPSAERTWDFATLASAGCTRVTYTSRVSQSGRSEGLQFRMACLCIRCVAERFARNSGRCAALRPTSKPSRTTVTAQSAQCRRRLSLRICFPQPRQRQSGFGVSTVGKDGRPFASRRCCWVNGVGSERRAFDCDVLLQSVRAMYSAQGATSLPQTGAVSRAGEITHRRRRRNQLPESCTVLN